jgi:hypothetical protein
MDYPEEIQESERRGRKKAVQVLYEAWKTNTLGDLCLGLPAILAYFSLPLKDEDLDEWFDSLKATTMGYRELAKKRVPDALSDEKKLEAIRRFINEDNVGYG